MCMRLYKLVAKICNHTHQGLDLCLLRQKTQSQQLYLLPPKLHESVRVEQNSLLQLAHFVFTTSLFLAPGTYLLSQLFTHSHVSSLHTMSIPSPITHLYRLCNYTKKQCMKLGNSFLGKSQFNQPTFLDLVTFWWLPHHYWDCSPHDYILGIPQSISMQLS